MLGSLITSMTSIIEFLYDVIVAFTGIMHEAWFEILEFVHVNFSEDKEVLCDGFGSGT